MTIRIIYYSGATYWIWIGIITSITIIINTFIIISAKKQPENRKSRSLLIITALINIIISIVSLFIPVMLYYGYDLSEYQIYASYKFFVGFLLSFSTLISYGLLIILFVRRNPHSVDKFLMVAGISMIIAQIIVISADFIYFNYILKLLIFEPSYVFKEDLIWVLYIIFNDLFTTFYTLSLVLFIVYGVSDRDKYIAIAFILAILRDSTNGLMYWFLNQIL